MYRNTTEFTFSNDDNTKVNIEPYSGIMLKSEQSYQANYVFDSYADQLDSFTFLVPAYIYKVKLEPGKDFVKEYFKDIRMMEDTRKLILIICFSVGGVLFALGISACVIIFIKSHKADSVVDENETKGSLTSADDKIN